MSKILKMLAAGTTVLGVLLTLWALMRLPWPQALPWQGGGALLRYLLFVAVCSVLVVFGSTWSKRNPFSVGVTIAGAIAVLAGMLWPLVVAIWFFVASVLLGRRISAFSKVDGSGVSILLAFVLGAGVYAWVVGLIAHFPVNYPGVYGFGLALPILLDRKAAFGLMQEIFRFLCQRDVENTAGRWIDRALVVIGLVYFVVALMPEVGYDPLAMHLFIPSHMYDRHQWGFDASTYVWAVMPMLADWIFSIGYMLGGEIASRLINLVFLLTLTSVARDLAIWVGGAHNAGRLAALIVISTPLTFTAGSTLHVEAVWASFLVGGTLAILRLATSRQRTGFDLLAGGALLGCALATKAITLLMLPLLGGLLLWRWRNWVRRELFSVAGAGLVAFAIIGMIPYADAWRLTGNPVFPFFNQLFQSPLFPVENFRDMRWTRGVTWDILYAITFHSDRYQEARAGAPGFQWLLLLIPTAFLLAGNKSRRGMLLMLLGCLFVVLVFRSTSYLRYIFPAVVLLSAAMAVAIELGASSGGRLGKVPLLGAFAMLLSLNVLFLNSASWYGDFQLRPIFDPKAREAYVTTRLPERAAVELVNNLNTARNPVAFLASPFGADLKADALYANWYNRGFRNSLSQVQSDEDAFDLLADRSIDFVILDRAWRGDGGKDETQRAHILNVTTEIAAIGPISVRKLNSDRRFRRELLINHDFRSTDGWVFSPGSVFEAATGSVLVSEPSPVTQLVAVKAGRQYRNVVIARCAARPAKGRLQINWLDANGGFIKADGIAFDCSIEWKEHEMTVVAPPGAGMAVVYTSGHTGESIAYRGNSLLQ